MISTHTCMLGFPILLFPIIYYLPLSNKIFKYSQRSIWEFWFPHQFMFSQFLFFFILKFLNLLVKCLFLIIILSLLIKTSYSLILTKKSYALSRSHWKSKAANRKTNKNKHTVHPLPFWWKGKGQRKWKTWNQHTSRLKVTKWLCQVSFSINKWKVCFPPTQYWVEPKVQMSPGTNTCLLHLIHLYILFSALGLLIALNSG